MDDWTRIPEDEIMLTGQHRFTFSTGSETYSLSYDPNAIHRFTFKLGELSEIWFIEIQEVKGKSYRWQGVGYSDDWFPDGAAWYELVWDDNPKIYFWGNQVLIREDRLLEVFPG